jgi:group I intron endonuclease
MGKSSLPQSSIYCIRNIASGRVYVGSAVNTAQRWRAHLHRLRNGSHHSVVLQRSWDKHGPSAFLFEILEIVHDTTELVAKEQTWIDLLHAACPRHGFNRSPTAGNPLGTRHSIQTKMKHSIARKGKQRPPFSAEHRARISDARKGTKATLKARANMAAAHKGRKRPPRTEAHCAKLSAAKMGHVRSMESRRKQSEATKGKKIPLERLAAHRARLRVANKRRSTGDLTDQMLLPL